MHYDWGLRAIKSVLVVAGAFKRAETTVDEMALLFRALRDFNLPKIVGDVVDENNRVVAEAAKLQGKLDMAQRLMNALGSEGDRWTNSITAMKVQTELIVGDVLMASAFVSYGGCFNKKYRDVLINKTFAPFFLAEKIPTSPDIDPLKLFVRFGNHSGMEQSRITIGSCVGRKCRNRHHGRTLASIDRSSTSGCCVGSRKRKQKLSSICSNGRQANFECHGTCT
jgi:hypothetical protein